MILLTADKTHVCEPALQDCLHWWPSPAGDGLKAGGVGTVLGVASFVARSMDGQAARPDVAACVSSGVFDVCLDVMAALEAGGAKGLQTVEHMGLYSTMSVVSRCCSHPGCEDKIRGVASALAFCLEHSLEYAEATGQTTGSLAAQLCTSTRSVPHSWPPAVW